MVHLSTTKNRKDFEKRWEIIFGKKKKTNNMPIYTYENTVKEDKKTKKEKAEKIKNAKIFKTKRCPHCATFNLITDLDVDSWLLCKKCGWNSSDPYVK